MISTEFEKNSYYKLKTVGIEAVSAAEALLKQYPLSKMFLEILGRYLMDQIQFGIFSPGSEIITQGAKGKDLFLICNHQADVQVNTKRILQLQAPVLVGDKGIIDRESVRNATIRISADGDSLVVKIPMELFIRSFTKSNISDKEFKQEKKIYFHLFLEVQERLFKYSELQKNLWEEINTSLHSLNTQLIVGSLNQQEEKEWGDKVWLVIITFLRSAFQVAWPDQLGYSVKNLTKFLIRIQNKKLPRAAFKGTDQQYAFKQQMLWKAWLNSLSELLVKSLPSNQLPISIGEIELFNPRIYQMRISQLLRSIENKFMLKKVKPREDTYNPSLLKASQFFGRDVKKHEFNLDAYTKAVDKQFAFKNPNRVMAQLTQQIAQLTATCENEFNESVSKMQHFLEKIKKLAFFENDKKEISQVDSKSIQACVEVINMGFKAYHKTTVGHSHVHIGEVRFSKTGSPVIRDLIKSCGSELVRRKIDKANQKLITMLDLSGNSLSVARIGDFLHFCEAYAADLVSPVQLSRQYWIPISPGIALEREGTPFSLLRPGTLLGGKCWDLSEDEDESGYSWSLAFPKQKLDAHHSYLICVIPETRLPWKINSSPLEKEFNTDHLPLIQWLMAQHLSHLGLIEQERDLLFDRYARISEVVVTEKKVQEFESNKAVVSEQNYSKIRVLVMETLGLDMGRNPRLSSELLSKQIYNRVLEQTKKGFPGLTIEEQGNKAYTLWRYLQSQIVSEVYIKAAGKQIKLEAPKSVFELIGLEIEKRLKKKAIRNDDEALNMLSSPPEIDLKKILEGAAEMMSDKKLEFALELLHILENYVVEMTDEAVSYQKRLKEVSSIKTEFDIKELQTQFISESIGKLQKTLLKKLPPESRGQPVASVQSDIVRDTQTPVETL